MKIKNISVPFAQVANQVLNDSRLSWRAKGIFAYIQSKPEEWDFSSIRMALDAKDGRDSTREGIRELEEIGYLTRTKNGDGTLEMELFLVEPETEKPSKDEPETDSPTDGKAVGRESRPISNKESYKERNTSKKEVQVELPEWLNREKWEEWEQHRKEIKKKLTPLTVKKQIKLLSNYIPIYDLIIEQSIQNGWTGLFPEKVDQKMINEAKLKKSDEVRRVQKPIEEQYPELTEEQRETNRKKLREIKETLLTKVTA